MPTLHPLDPIGPPSGARRLLDRLRAPFVGPGRSAANGQGSPPDGDRPLEATPSRIGYALYATGPPPETPDDHPDGGAELGFPDAPVVAGLDAGGRLFDTTAATVADGGLRIRYHLQFGGREAPYDLTHVGGGTYHSDTHQTFEWTDQERFQQLDAFLDRGASYRVEVRDVVQLYEPHGAFDWSVSRSDFTAAEAGDPILTLLTVVWDDDGPANGTAASRAGDPSPAAGSGTPPFPTDLTPNVAGDTIPETVRGFLADPAEVGIR